jgi:Ni/Fe-hydrogenase subunit HybB-like protein
VSIARYDLGTEARVWFGVAAAPAAWTIQHVFGYGLSEVACDPGAGTSATTFNIEAAIVSGVGVLIALAGLVAALTVFRATEAETPPPEGRRHFLGAVGLTISPLFIAIMLMSGIGSIILEKCHQA